MAIYFVSDLHLAAARPRCVEIILRFLSGPARSSSALYILGDLFEYWIGDDDRADATNEAVLAGIASLTQAGVPVFFMPGNRDFLIGAHTAARTGMTILADPMVVNLFDRPTLLAHGDAYCVGDAPYQAFRRCVRSAWFRTGFGMLPLGARRAFARSVRRKSEQGKLKKPATIMDVDSTAIDDALRTARCELMIHGHTHRPARHVHIVDGRQCERWVLADWYETGSCLRMDKNAITTMQLH